MLAPQRSQSVYYLDIKQQQKLQLMKNSLCEFRSQITYAEESCSGPGSNKGKRVPWEKQLSAQEWNKYLGREFINQDGWMEQHAP